MIVQTATTIPLSLTVSRDAVGGVAALTLTVAVRRLSDGFYLDWNDATFKASGWTTKNGAMTDKGAGRYERSLAVTSAAGTVLLAEYACANVGYELSATEEVQVVAALNDLPASVWADSSATTLVARIALLHKLARNRIVEAAGSPGTLILYDDDDVTPLLTWLLLDSSGGAVTAQVGAPARRSAAT